MRFEKVLPVPDKKEIVIKDACILFDLVDLKLLGAFFRLAVTAISTAQVIGEITDEEQLKEVTTYIDNGLLQVDNSAKYESIVEISEQYPGLSTADSSVLELAIRKDAVIFSSDGLLRKVSSKNGLIVRGILWIIEQLYDSGLISKKEALEKLKLYEAINRRAPRKEISELTLKIQSESKQ